MERTRMRRTTRLASVGAAIGLIVGLLAPSAPASGACAAAMRHTMQSGSMETIPLRTLYIEMKTDKKVYKVGDTAKIEVTVTRPSDEDPAGQGVATPRPTSIPAEDITVGVGLRIGRVFLYGFGPPTDADGKTTVSIHIKPYAPAGKAIVDIFAWKTQLDTPCLIVEEQGYHSHPGAFAVKK
jgi:hypothetical protein